MRKSGARLRAVLTAHPRWATQLTPVKVLVAAMFCWAVLVMPPPNVYWAMAALAVLTTTAVYVALVTAQDAYIFFSATILADNHERLTKSIREVGFSNWLYRNGGEHLMHAFQYKNHITELTPDERYELAAYRVRYILSDPRERNWLMPVLLGASLCGIVVSTLICRFIMPKTTKRLYDGIDRWLTRNKQLNNLDD